MPHLLFQITFITSVSSSMLVVKIYSTKIFAQKTATVKTLYEGFSHIYIILINIEPGFQCINREWTKLFAGNWNKMTVWFNKNLECYGSMSLWSDLLVPYYKDIPSHFLKANKEQSVANRSCDDKERCQERLVRMTLKATMAMSYSQ